MLTSSKRDNVWVGVRNTSSITLHILSIDQVTFHSLDIHISGGLIEHQYLVLPEQSSRQTHQLPLTNTEVGPSLCDLAMQLPLQLLDNWFQLNLETNMSEMRR